MNNGNGNGFVPEELIDRRTPVDQLEPLLKPFDEIRYARLQAVRLLNAFGNAIERPLRNPHVTVRDIATAFWGACYALGLNCADGISMSERAAELGVERAAISKKARSFVSANNLEPSWHMKRESAVDAYTEARIAVVERSAVQGKTPQLPLSGSFLKNKNFAGCEAAVSCQRPQPRVLHHSHE